MADFGIQPAPVTPTHIHTFTRYALSQEMGRLFLPGQPGALTWVANRACYIPLTLPFPYLVQRVFWVNGSTLTSSNADLGIYSTSGTKIYSTGSTAMSGASALQYVAVSTPFVLPPGMYYLAWSCDNTTSRGYGNSGPSATQLRMCGMTMESSALPLPAALTPVTWTGNGPQVCGITRTSTGF